MVQGPLVRSPLVDQAAARLRRQIADGTWPVGGRLPGETTLAAELGVGRSTVREALRALAGAGLVRSRQGAGVFVLATEPVLDLAAKLKLAAVSEVYEVRGMIEIQAARLAAMRRTDEDVAALEAALARRREASAGDTAGFIETDIALHAVVIDAAHNPALTAVFAEFRPILQRGLVDLVELLGLRDEDPNVGEEAHSALVEAIRAGDGERAASVLRKEIETSLAHLERAAVAAGSAESPG